MHINCVQEAQMSAYSELDEWRCCTNVKDNTYSCYASLTATASGEWILFEFTHAIVITKVRIKQSHLCDSAHTIDVLCSNSDVGPWAQIATIVDDEGNEWIEWS